MKIILGQATKSLISGIALTLVIIIMFSVGQFLLIGCASYFNSSETKLSNFYTAYNNEEARYRVNPISGSSYNDFAQAGRAEEYKTIVQNYVRNILYKKVEEHGFEQYVLNELYPIMLANYAGIDRCIDEFEEGTGVRDSQRIGNEYYTRLKSYCISPNVFDKFQLNVMEGKDFSDFTDFTYRDGMTIPIVMGYEYRPYYAIGDRINANDGLITGTTVYGESAAVDTIFSKLVCEVVGFLEPGAAILDPDDGNAVDPIGLDYHVLYPAVDYTDLIFSEPNPEHVKQYLSTLPARVQGVAVVQRGGEDRITEYYKELGFEKRVVVVVSTPIMIVSGIFKLEAKNYFKTLMATAGLIVASATLCLSINMTNKLLSNFKTYAIHQISGGTLSGVKWIMVTEGIILMVISNLLAFGGAFLFGDKVFTYTKSQIFGISVAGVSPIAVLFALGVSLLILFFSMLVPFIKISRVEFDTLLRGRE